MATLPKFVISSTISFVFVWPYWQEYIYKSDCALQFLYHYLVQIGQI